MTIQEAIQQCLTKDDLFGRPASWQGSGSGLDLARRLDADRVRRVISLGTANNLLGAYWHPNPQEILADWETVTNHDLAVEVCKINDPDI
jgi:hypothetical protein